ncbi:terminase small subunit [Brucella sp. HL-2]|nr:terminase small subunit [Brucella sp. HL-2]MCV9910207.1 terminase small subunit [Brucella sp. HL-2]
MTRAKQNKSAVLTDQQSLFAKEFCLDCNGTQAAIRAGYSEKTARQQASRLLSNVNVQDEIQRQFASRSERIGYDADALLNELLKDKDADISEIYYRENNTLKPVHEWPAHFRRGGLVVGVKTRELFEKVPVVDEATGKTKMRREKIGETVEVKFANKLTVKELVGKHIGINAFRDTNDPDKNRGDSIQELAQLLTGRAIGPSAG